MSIRNRFNEKMSRRQVRIACGCLTADKLWSSEVKSDGYSGIIKKADEIAGLLLKLMPLSPVLGGSILLLYLHNISRPELFMSSIASLYGLVALFLGGALVLFAFSLTFIAPWGILSYVLMERGKHGVWKASIWRVTATFSAFPFLVLVIATLGALGTFETYTVMGIVFLLSMFSLLPFDNSEVRVEKCGLIEKSKNFLVQKGWIFPLSGGMCIAALFCSFPIVVLVTLVDSEVIQIVLVMGYAIFSAFMGFALAKIKDWKVWAVFGGTVSFVVIIYMNGPVLSGAAKLLGIRHDDARWYLMVDSKKTQAVLLEDIPRSPDGNYILAATPFSFGENVVICNSKDSKIVTGECVTLDHSEVRLSGKDPSKAK